MSNRNLDRFLAPWVFVLTGIVFNVLSAVITHYFIGLNNDEINVIERQVQSRQVLIDSLWQSKTEIERKQEFFILLLSNRPDKPALAETHYRDYLQEIFDTHNLQQFETRLANDPGLDLLLDLSSAAQEAVINSINATYFETLQLQENKMPLERANSRLFSIAIFLQVVGLILVLSRDLRRH